MTRPITTLILPISADGKLVSRDAILTDKDPSWRSRPGVIGYLQQFFDFSGSDSYTLTTGAVMALSGVNTKDGSPDPSDLKLVVLDFDHSLTENGIKYLQKSVKELIIINKIMSPKQILEFLGTKKVKNLTIHSTPMNALWLQNNLINYLTLIIYPLIVGESGSPVTSIGLTDPRTLKLLESRTFDTNYLCLRYELNLSNN